MLIWALAIIFCGLGLFYLFGEVRFLSSWSGLSSELRELQKAKSLLHELADTLESGLVLNPDHFSKIRTLALPWNELIFESLQELRRQGGALLPTIKRIRVLAEEHASAIKEARSKSMQAYAQSLVCAGLVPVFGSTLYFILPAVGEHWRTWLCVCSGAMVLALFSALWLLKMAEKARWGGLKNSERNWILDSQCALERFLALVRTGVPMDLAWARSCELLKKRAPILALKWGFSVWESAQEYPNQGGSKIIILNLGIQVKKILQVSLREGRPCLDNVETLLRAFREDLRGCVERELALLNIRAMKPLFFCVAPALFSLLSVGLYMSYVWM